MENLFSTCTVINPRTDALRSKGENRSGEYRKDGIVGVSVTEAKFEGRRFIVRLLTNFLWSVGLLKAIGTMDKVVLIVDGTRLMNEAVV